MVMKNDKNRSNESTAYDELDSNPVLPAISDDIKLSLGSAQHGKSANWKKNHIKADYPSSEQISKQNSAKQ